MKRTIRISLLLMVAIILAAGCKKKDIVAKVGDIEITKKDLDYRAKVSEVYYPKSGQPYVALAQLIQSYLDESVLKAVGGKADDAAWEAEAKRVDENTKAPEVLKKIKDVYGLDHAGYIKTFIRPVYAERYLYNEIFLKSKDISKDQNEQAKKFLAEAIANPSQFEAIATKMSLKASKMKLNENTGIAPFEESKKVLSRPENPEPAGMEQAKFLIDKIDKLSPGSVYPEIIEWQEGFQMIMLVDKKDKDYIVETVSVPKRDYDSWFWENAAKVPVKITDPALKAELVKQVGWASKLKFQ